MTTTEDRRTAYRYETSVGCKLSYVKDLRIIAVSAALIDVSLSGARVSCPEPIPLGTMVMIDVDGHKPFYADVARQGATSNGGGAVLGVKYADSGIPFPLFASLAFEDDLDDSDVAGNPEPPPTEAH